MKVTVKDPSIDLDIELDDTKLYTYTRIKRVPIDRTNPKSLMENPDPIIIITSGVPAELQKQIDKIILEFCEL